MRRRGVRADGRSAEGGRKKRDGAPAARVRAKRRLAAGLVLLAAAGVLQAAARRVPGFGEWYASHVYPWIVGTYGRIFGLFPFSVGEILLYFSIVWLIWQMVSHFHGISQALSTLAAAAGVLAFLYTACCGINYYRKPFSDDLDREIRESSAEELYRLCEYLTEKVNGTVDHSPYTDSWADAGREAMEKLGGTYPQLAGYYPAPKAVAASRLLSIQQLSGVYCPFTAEANYNREMTAYNIPHAICHELSHLRGFMREDEANFIGYLACIGSDSRAFRYSGYLTGWVYACNALAAQDMERYRQLSGRLDAAVREDLRDNSRFWARFEGKAAKISNQLNDAYLKVNSQRDGVRSYGRMVDLMLAYYRDAG